MPRTAPRQELLSPSEWRGFWILSRRHPLTIAEIGRELARLEPGEPPLNDNTVRTFVKRLQGKGYLAVDASAGRDLLAYRPSVPYETALRFHVSRFLDQFALGGRADLEILRAVLEERLAAPAAGSV
jgi:predicted transcriptional regulator